MSHAYTRCIYICPCIYVHIECIFNNYMCVYIETARQPDTEERDRDGNQGHCLEIRAHTGLTRT